MNKNWKQEALRNYRVRNKLLSFVHQVLEYTVPEEVFSSSVIALPQAEDETKYFIFVDKDGKFRLLHFSVVAHRNSITPNITLAFTDKYGFESAVGQGTMEVFNSGVPEIVWSDLYKFYGYYMGCIKKQHLNAYMQREKENNKKWWQKILR